ncbi:MAG: diadenylate cyclase [Pseudomonadota bacterium]|uniref:Diadenylate cyclase n=1 Tax=Candidatus Desulfatibia profunda TaxID=2841695 RepID=A0A8J6NMZ0_9BACT|nr:DNA integrity scanning protein DisA nucleotide-binding domain protein [Candidatus Desulfatibia profunda]MBL7180674.1 DNA integrity scanning protein DisA nucleotide-binding domain protein [Desulfobacterales bacterium]
MNALFSFFAILRWQDVFDILLNSYILFRFYVLFRGTTVLRVIAGIAILYVFRQIAVFFGLILTSWALQGIMAVAALIIIIVFRNEIRSVLQAKNLKTILWGVPQKPFHTPMKIIAESIGTLSRRHIGALMVFPAKDDLEEVVQKGVRWNGLASKEMITSIFWPDNPVHDGAAIIHGDRITEVSVILPLSHSDDLPSRYGTRHRAALGLAEVTDALIVVVSEETGRVVVAKNSKIIEIRSSDELIKNLRAHAGISEEDQGLLRKSRFELGSAALLFIILVTGVWFSFSKGLDTLITLEIPVEYTTRDPSMEIIDTSANAVSLQLGGSGTLIKSMRPEQVHVRLALDKAVAGRNTFSITKDNITLPPGIYLKKITPSVVEATLDTTIKKKLPVQVDWVGKLPENLMLSKVKVDPETIEIVGGNRILNNISTIYTEKAQLDNIRESGNLTLSPVLDPASLKIASDSKNKINVSYVIKPRQP